MEIKSNIDTDCVIDKVLTFDTKEKYPSEPSQTLALTDLKLTYSDEDKKIHNYKFAVSANDQKDMSKLANAKIVMCGKETITPSDGTEDIKVESGSEFFTIK